MLGGGEQDYRSFFALQAMQLGNPCKAELNDVERRFREGVLVDALQLLVVELGKKCSPIGKCRRSTSHWVRYCKIIDASMMNDILVVVGVFFE